MSPSTKITILGDICPTQDTASYFEEGNSEKLFNNLLMDLKESDFVVGNLEFVLTNVPNPIQKAGPVLTGKIKCVNVLKNANFKLLSLANNHIKDCGEKGVASTLEACENFHISTLGAAENLQKAKLPYITTINNLKVGFIAFAEQEFNTASKTESGANFLDPFEDLDLIEKTKALVDYLIILYHGGAEYYTYPSPLLKKKCRKFIDKGADLVTCQHSHCVGTVDDYKNKKIIYGQGNSVFGYREKCPSWNEGLVIDLIWKDGLKTPELQLVPIVATKSGIQKMNETSASELLSVVAEKSKHITDDDFLEKNWLKFCKQKQSLYLPFLFGFNRFFIHLNRITKNRLVNLVYPKSKRITSHNMFRCESHREVMNTIFKNCNK